MTDKLYNYDKKKITAPTWQQILVVLSHILGKLNNLCVKSASSRDLQNLYSHISTHITALNALGILALATCKTLVKILITKPYEH